MDVEHTTNKPKRLLRRQAVIDRCGIGTSQIYDLIALGQFPKPVPIGTRAVAWLESEVEAWIDERLKQRENPTAPRSGSIRRSRQVMAAA